MAGVLHDRAKKAVPALPPDSDCAGSGGFDGVGDECVQSLLQGPAVPGDPAPGAALDRHGRCAGSDRGVHERIEGEGLGLPPRADQTFARALEQIEGAGELGARDLEGLARIFAALDPAIGSFQMERDRRQRRRQVVKKATKEVAPGLARRGICSLPQVGTLCARDRPQGRIV